MTIDVSLLCANCEDEYRDLLDTAPAAMFNHSLAYRNFLCRILPDATTDCLLANEGGQIVGALPMLSRDGPFGRVVNSLPFYGSHGGVICRPGAQPDVTSALLAAFDAHCIALNASCSTLIESPLDPFRERYANYVSDFTDQRIGQISPLPAAPSSADAEQCLLAQFHLKTRNMVRKGMRGGFEIGHDGSEETFRELHAIHDENMREIGGVAKPRAVFEAIRACFRYDEDYRIYTARSDGRIVSALLLFYFKNMVEYFTPATRGEFRGSQPLSALIYNAMLDAILERKSSQWNWGGTWLTQDGVYRFKSRWGTRDLPYCYHIKLPHGREVLSSMTREKLLDMYPYFYVVPFSALEGA